jgi:hypothetical protein
LPLRQLSSRPTPPPPPTPVGASPDPYEPNDLPPIVQGQAPIRSFVNVGQQLTNLNFYTQPNTNTLQFGDVDWYFFYGRGGAAYRVTTEVQPGVDTELFIYRPDQLPQRATPFTTTRPAGLQRRLPAAQPRLAGDLRRALRRAVLDQGLEQGPGPARGRSNV